MGYETFAFTGKLTGPGGAPHRGKVTITPTVSVVRDVSGNVVIAGPVTRDIDPSGSFRFDGLPCTDDPGLSPTGFGYTVSIQTFTAKYESKVFDAPRGTGVRDYSQLVSIPIPTPIDPLPVSLADFSANDTEVRGLITDLDTTKADQQFVVDESARIDTELAGKATPADVSTAVAAEATRVDSSFQAIAFGIDADGNPYYDPDVAPAELARVEVVDGVVVVTRDTQSVAVVTADVTDAQAARLDGLDTTVAAKANTTELRRYPKRGRTFSALSTGRPLDRLPSVPATPATLTLNATPASPVSVTAQAARPMVTFKGGVCSIVTTNTNVDAWRNTVPSKYGQSGLQSIYAVEFDIRGTDVALRLRDNISSNGVRLWVWVNGAPQTADYVSVGVTPSGGIFNYRISGMPTGTNRVKVYLHNCDFAGFNKAAADLIQPTPSSELKMGVLGDSWVQGSGDVLPGRTFLRTAAILLGAQVFCDGQGGTGYVTATTDPTLNVYKNRLAGLASAPIDFLVIEGSLNDDVNNDAAPATIQAEATATYDAWQTLRPDCPIIVIGVQSVGDDATQGDAQADRVANNNAVKAAAQAHPHVLGFIDALGEKWMSGTGYVGSGTGSGPATWAMNSVFHPSLEGATMLGTRAAARIAQVLETA